MTLAMPAAWAEHVTNTHDPCACLGLRCDVIGVDRDGVRTVVEVKTGSRQWTHWVQLAAQQVLADAPRGILLVLGKDGNYQTPRRPEWADNVATTWRQVQSAAMTAHLRMRHDPKAQMSEDGPHALRRADGVRVPGVGTVLRLAGLVDLSAIPPDILARAAAKGSAVHRYIEMMFDGGGGLDADSVPVELRGFLASFWRFLDTTGFMVEGVEVPLVYNCGGV
jgi:hypothetical protein